MDYTGFVRSLELPVGFTPPRQLIHEDISALAISRADLDDDVRGINSSLDLIRQTRGGGWPTEAVSADDNYVDLRPGLLHEALPGAQTVDHRGFPVQQPYFSNTEIPRLETPT